MEASGPAGTWGIPPDLSAASKATEALVEDVWGVRAATEAYWSAYGRRQSWRV